MSTKTIENQEGHRRPNTISDYTQTTKSLSFEEC